MANFQDLLGLVLVQINTVGEYDDELHFITNDGRVFKQYHQQDCCEFVSIEDIAGDLNDLLGSPILRAEERSEEKPTAEYEDVGEWTFYELATIKGSATIRWYGTSNGYYSTAVSFEEVTGGK